MKALTVKQSNILKFVAEFQSEMHMPPTVYEIAERFGIKTSTVFAHLKALQRKNKLIRSSKARSIELTEKNITDGTSRPKDGLAKIAILSDFDLRSGNSNGKTSDNLTIASDMISSVCGAFGYRVSADNMRTLGIFAGDLMVVIHSATRPDNGDVAVVGIKGHVVICSFFRHDGEVSELRDDNGSTLINNSDLRVFGVAKLLVRRY